MTDLRRFEVTNAPHKNVSIKRRSVLRRQRRKCRSAEPTIAMFNAIVQRGRLLGFGSNESYDMLQVARMDCCMTNIQCVFDSGHNSCIIRVDASLNILFMLVVSYVE